MLSNFKQPRLSGWIYALVGLWAVMVGTGMLLLANYVNQPGTSGVAPQELADCKPSAMAHGKYHLAMFVHPRCPCSSASIRELSRLLTSCQGRVEAIVYCFRPANETDAWIQGSLAEAAAAIPGVTVQSDPAGELARQYGAETSGQVLLYDPQGKLCFQGGITAGRGHEGDNLGAAAIRARVLGKEPTPDTMAPVFGCELRTLSEEGR